MFDSDSFCKECSRREIFSFFVNCEGKIINLFNSKEVEVKRIYEVKIDIRDGLVGRLTDLRYYPLFEIYWGDYIK